MSMVRSFSVLAAICVVLLVIVLGTRESGVDRMTTHLVGAAAPPVAGNTIGGEFWNLDDERGRWVLVNFFSTTCIPCVREHPELLSFARSQIGDKGVKIVSIAFDDKSSSVETFFEKNGGGWPVLAKDTGRIAVDWGVIAVPESYLVSPTGFVAAKVIGGVKRSEIEELLSKASDLSL